MENCAEIKIWRYMDLAKFISLLVTESLYFVCPLKFNDPYEGFLPKSHIEAESEALEPIVQDIILVRNQLADQFSDSIDLQQLDTKIDNLSLLKEAWREASRKFGVSCWHKSEYESEAMWKLYSTSGQGIAIESTIGQLTLSLKNIKGVIIDNVRYRDFDKDPVEKGHKHYRLFLKRKSFEYEKELRATVLLPNEKEGEGDYIKCDLNTLITHIHVSPFAPNYFKDAVETICLGEFHGFKKTVIKSNLFNTPTYEIKIKNKI